MNDDMQQIYGKDTNEDKILHIYIIILKRSNSMSANQWWITLSRRYKVSLGRRLDCLVIQLQGFQSRTQATILYMD